MSLLSFRGAGGAPARERDVSPRAAHRRFHNNAPWELQNASGEAGRRRGLTQRELATAADVSLSLVKKLEQGTITDLRLETLHKFAIVLRVPTSNLVVGPESEDPVIPDRWDDVRDALYRNAPDDGITEQATPQGVLDSLAALMPAWQANEYSQVHGMLPALIRDALSLDDDGRVARSRVLNATAWMLNMTRQFDDALTAARLALDAAPDLPESMAAISMMTWCLLRQGQAGEAGTLAAQWATGRNPGSHALRPGNWRHTGRCCYTSRTP